VKRAVLAAIRFYRRRISPSFPATCRFTPTCSQYAYEAIERYGIGRGSGLALKRISKCGPWHQGGYDPVP